jgi:hypothetical protein
MPTDPLTPVYSGMCKETTVNSPNQATMINAISDLLVSVGWTSEGLLATTVISYPLGAPTVPSITPGPDLTVVCCGSYFVVVGSTGFVGYDPATEIPCVTSACQFFPWGLTPESTLDNLADAITFGTSFNAEVVVDTFPAFHIQMTCKFGGPDFNFIPVAGDGGFGISEATGGGGYTLRSSTATSPGYSTSQYGFDLTSGPVYALLVPGGNPLVFNFNIAGTNTAQSVQDCSSAQYVLVGNGSTFAMFPGTPASLGNTTLITCAPWIPHNFVFTYAVFAAWGGAPGYWTQHSYFNRQVVVTALNGAANTYSNVGGYPRILAFYNPSNTLNAPAGIPIVIGAYVMMGASSTDTAYVVGIMADCVVIQQAVGDGAMIDSHRMRSLIRDSTVSPLTVTMATDQ